MLQIDRITREDLPALAALNEELSGEPTDLAAVEAVFAEVEGNPDYILMAGRLDGVLIGSLMGVVCRQLARAGKPFMLMENFVVSRTQRGRGFGRLMLARIEEEARARGCRSIVFTSSTRRKAAHAFYESAGYRLDEAIGFRKIF